MAFFGAGGLALALAGCMSAEPSGWRTSPADPTLGLRTSGYSDVTAGVKRFRVVEPKDWRELNRAVGPQGGAMPGMDMTPRRDTGGR